MANIWWKPSLKTSPTTYPHSDPQCHPTKPDEPHRAHPTTRPFISHIPLFPCSSNPFHSSPRFFYFDWLTVHEYLWMFIFPRADLFWEFNDSTHELSGVDEKISFLLFPIFSLFSRLYVVENFISSRFDIEYFSLRLYPWFSKKKKPVNLTRKRIAKKNMITRNSLCSMPY